mmetsp:Transcript_18838/g.33448  ORF Transcript_18838/g.33448 Transcript_18838/m.33448 type:complete len:142 (-) Transcript_18838:2508-2933(-)
MEWWRRHHKNKHPFCRPRTFWAAQKLCASTRMQPKQGPRHSSSEATPAESILMTNLSMPPSTPSSSSQVLCLSGAKRGGQIFSQKASSPCPSLPGAIETTPSPANSSSLDLCVKGKRVPSAAGQTGNPADPTDTAHLDLAA